jgi:hypothetical protein
MKMELNSNLRKGGNLGTLSLSKKLIWKQSLDLREWLKQGSSSLSARTVIDKEKDTGQASKKLAQRRNIVTVVFTVYCKKSF